jgi:glycosyltransferase involved in cell wall biosynthesis
VHEFRRVAPAKAYFAPEARRNASSFVSDCDIVHGHGFYTALNWTFGSRARKFGKPLVYHPQGMLEPWILSRSRGKKRIAHWLFEDANFRHAGLWRALTLREADQIRAIGIEGPIVVAPNGVDVAAFAGATESRPKSRRVMLFLGRLHPKKGADILLRAWAQSGAAAADWELVIAGPDEIGHREQLESIVASESLAGSVRFTGPVKGREKTDLIHSADVFVLPSHSEGFPVAVLEAMAASKPVIVTPGCNFPEAPAAGAGWLVDPQGPALRDLLCSVFETDDAELRQRGLAGRALVERDYAWNAIAQKLIDAIRAHIN